MLVLWKVLDQGIYFFNFRLWWNYIEKCGISQIICNFWIKEENITIRKSGNIYSNNSLNVNVFFQIIGSFINHFQYVLIISAFLFQWKIVFFLRQIFSQIRYKEQNVLTIHSIFSHDFYQNKVKNGTFICL